MMMAATIAWGHHERWDAGGYPRGLTGAESPIEARITSVVDVYDALRSKRPYKPGFDLERPCRSCSTATGEQPRLILIPKSWKSSAINPANSQRFSLGWRIDG
jgi:response regulator RpfG family c-di-GMP phosphodiesterase